MKNYLKEMFEKFTDAVKELNKPKSANKTTPLIIEEPTPEESRKVQLYRQCRSHLETGGEITFTGRHLHTAARRMSERLFADEQYAGLPLSARSRKRGH